VRGPRKVRWLGAIPGGSPRATLALLDTDLDWNPEAVATRAEKTASGWRLTGVKRYVAWSHVADVVLVPARAPGGVSLFLVDPLARGLTSSPVQSMDPGLRLAQLTFDQVPVRGDEVLGAPGSAGPRLLRLLRRAGVGGPAEMLGAARRCLDMAGGSAKVSAQVRPP